VDVRVLLFAIAVSTVVAIAMPLLPALAAWRHRPSDALKAGARTVEPGLGSIRRPSLQQALVVGEIALATVLLASAALMARSLQRQMDVRLGFEPAGVTVARVSMEGGREAAAARVSFVTRLREHLTRMPDVAAVGVGSDLPLTGRSSAATIVPDSAQPGEPRVRYYRHVVAPGYFAALGIRIMRGREFTDADREGAPLVAVINESGARRFWGAADPIGRQLLTNDSANPRIEIVGVAADARFRDLRTDIAAARAEPDIFFPYGQRTDSNLEVAVRTHSGEPISAAAFQAVIGRLDSALPIYQTQPLARAVALQTATARFASALMGTFSLVALLLAALGLYGLLAYVIGLSRRDIAIRLALGANGWVVGGLIVRNSLVLVLVGAAIGGAAAIAAGRAMGSLLFQTSSRDPVTLGAVTLLLLTVSAAATIPPARRAVRVQPQVALKD
jgi:predicted permease